MSERKREYIGLDVEILEAPDPSMRGLRGTVIDETRNTFMVRGGGKDRRIPKQGARFGFAADGGFVITGDEIPFRPEDRIKKAR